MPAWLIFLGGLMVGGTVGVLVGCLLAGIRDEEPRIEDWAPRRRTHE